MKVKVAGTAGFCWGVQRALRLLDAAAADGKRSVTWGALVHNGPVQVHLQDRGIPSVSPPDEVREGDRVVTRPHGMSAEDAAAAAKKGAVLLDTTCPHVAETRKTVVRLAEEGRNILIAGNREHDEVKALMDGLKGKVRVIASAEEARSVAAEEPLALVSQSTFGPALLEDVEEAVRERFPDVEVHRTLCGATEDRQDETRALAVDADVLVVVGPYHSGNARRLAEMCRETGKQTFHVEVPEDLPMGSLLEQARLSRRQALMEKYAEDPDRMLAVSSDPVKLDAEVVIGVTAGASTPPWVLKAVVDHLVAETRADLEKGLPRDLATGVDAGQGSAGA
jgi:4-hydroxy-3-methylbut-2-en-1-yl diphosphate reductase